MKKSLAIPLRVVITIHLLMCCIPLMAQGINLDKALKNLFFEYHTTKADVFDHNKIENIVSLVTDYNYEGLSDSAKYAYHRFSIDICYDKKEFEKEKTHINKAVKLSETSIGILNPYYIFLLMKQGKIMEELDIDRSIYIYQKAILISQTLIYNPKVQYPDFKLLTVCYGNVLTFLAELYDAKGWTSRLEELFRTAYKFRTYYSSKSDPSTYTDINSLSNYYQRKNEIIKSIELLEWELRDIRESGFCSSSAYVNALYFLGSAYSKANQNEKSLDSYRTAVKLVRDSLAGNDESLYDLYKNYCVKLAELNQFEELDKNLPIVQHYFIKLDSIRRYADMLFMITDASINNHMYDNADKYCDSLLRYPSYHIGYEEVIYSKKALTSFMCNKINAAIKWQKNALDYCFKYNGENSIIYTNYLADLAFMYKKNSMIEEAKKSYLKIIELLETNNRDTIPFYNQKINELCELYDEEKNYEVEYLFLKERKQKLSEKYGKSTTYYAWICNTLSIFEMNTGRLVEAKENNLIAEKLYLNIEGRNSLNHAAVIHNKGRINMLEGKNKQALKYLKESKEIQFSISGKVFENTEMYIHEIEDKLK